jgi:hypothetical protein
LTFNVEAAGGARVSLAVRLTGEKYNPEKSWIEFTGKLTVVFSSDRQATAKFEKYLVNMMERFSFKVANPAPQGLASSTATLDQQQGSETVPTNATPNQARPGTVATDAFFTRLGQQEGKEF